MPRRAPCIPTPRRADRTRVTGESYAAFLARSTNPTAAHLRRFVNTNLAKLPNEAASGICRGVRSERFFEAAFELVVGRILQELGARELQYEPLQATGKRPDFLARYDDGSVFVDARHPEWLAELGRAYRRDERLIEVIEDEIPPGWRYLVSRLPRIGLSEPVGAFRKALRIAFAPLPEPRKGQTLLVSNDDVTVRFHLELRAGRVRDRAWLGGSFNASFVAPDLQIAQALKKKREQLRGLPHPALVALGGALGASVDDYDIALFGRSVARLDGHGRTVAMGFDRGGAFAKPGLTETKQPTIAGVLAFAGMDVTRGRDPILYLHPRFSGNLPAALLRLEVRTLPDGPVSQPARVAGLFDGLTPRTRNAGSCRSSS